MKGLRDSLGWSYGTRYLLLAVQFVSTIVIARLVTPDDIGLYGVAAVFIGLGQLIREFGINRYIVYEPELNSERIRAASTLNLALGWSAGILIFFSAEPVGAFYGRPEVREVMHLLSINFVFVPLGAIIFAFLRRELRFREIMLVRVGSTLLGAVVGITTAWYGEGYRALVWSAIAGTVTTVALCHLYKPSGVSLRPGIRGIGHVLRFCRYAGPETIISHVGDTAPDWILGKALDMQAVGLFSRAVGTIALFRIAVLDGLLTVLLPYFSKNLREGKESGTAYAHAVACLSGLAWPFFVVLGLLSAPIIETLYGSQWREAAPLLQVMCIGAIPLALTSVASDALTGLGRIREVFHITVIMAALRVGIILVAAPYGLLEVAIALLLAPIINVIVVYHQVGRHLGVRLRDMSQAIWLNALTSLISALPAAIGIHLYGWTLGYSLSPLLVIVSASALLWLTAIYLIKPPLYGEIEPIMQRLGRRLRA